MRGNFSIKVNTNKKILHICFKGNINNVNAAKAFSEFKKVLPKISDEYIVVTNVREFEDASFEARLLLEKSIKLLDYIHPEKVFRVVNNTSDYGIFDEAYKNMQVSFKVSKITAIKNIE
jgi:predicted membrane-bound dolichyl-phosphate-mannose-protein mannosyltransferase